MTEPQHIDQNDFEEIVKQATQYAIKFNQAYVTVDHLTLALVTFKSFHQMLDSIGIDVKGLAIDLKNHIVKQEDLAKTSVDEPLRKTQGLERVFNRALTQVMFSGRQSMTPLDMYLSIISETNSHSVYFLEKYGVDRETLIESYLNSQTGIAADGPKMSDEQADQILAKYCENLNVQAKEGKIDPIIGRNDEIEEIIDVLAKRNKRNILMVGEPGVGKTAIAEGLALKLTLDDVPNYLKGNTVYSLDIGEMLAGSKYRGDFEEKLKTTIAALKHKDEASSDGKGKAILFIDEAHQMSGAGSTGSNSGPDFANMIKPALSKGDIKVIASTTWEEYSKSFEKDRALMRRFYRLSINEPSPEIAKKILKGLKPYFEEFHNGKITVDAINAAVDFSVRYQHDLFLPDKAIDLIDTACAKEKVKDKKFSIKRANIIAAVSKATGIPKDQIGTSDAKPVMNLEKEIKKVVFGQDEAVDTVVEKVYVAKAGLKEHDKPLGSFLFTGPTGVGKTELAKQLSNSLGLSLLRYDMSEYQEKHTVAKLIGAPPGYVGFEDSNTGGGKLVTDIQKNPNCIVLLDEVEKAHPDVMNILLQLMDDGNITGSNGKKADFRNGILIMTSNLGAQANEKNNIGFAKDLTKSGEDAKAVKEFFKPEFRNRLDGVIKFGKLDMIHIKRVVNKFIKELNDLMRERGHRVTLSEAAVDHLAKIGYEPTMGARPLKRQINDNIKVPLSHMILFDDLPAKSVIHVDALNKKFEFTIIDPAIKKVLDHVISESE